MATYISLVNYTDQGIANIKDAPKRLTAAKKLIASMGGKFKAAYLTMGDYDLVTIIEAPDDKTVARAVLTIAGAGNVRTTTCRAFTETEFREIVGSL